MDKKIKDRVYLKKTNKGNFDKFVLGLDVGGTHTNTCISGVKDNKIELIFSLHFKTKDLKSIEPAIKKTLKYAQENYSIKVYTAIIAAAGFVEDNKFVKLTNASWNLNADKIKENTNLDDVFIINDFQAIGYAINVLDHKNENQIFTVRGKNKKDKNANLTKSIIGAGTGLGKTTCLYNEKVDAYIPIPSEGGHSDFPIQNDFEKNLVEYIKKKRKIKEPLTYEELISGRGIEGIYQYLRDTKKYISTKFSEEIDKSKDKAPLISKYKEKDKTCRETFELFVKFYARCAKNFVLETLSTGGLYLAGGIVSKNKNFFKKNNFIKEFEKAYRRSNILKRTPVYIIMNYDVSLYGACFAAVNKKILGFK